MTYRGRISLIQSAVAEEFGVTVASLLSPRRDRTHTTPRMVAMYLAREDTGKSMVTIGRAFNRDHSTVMAACRRVPEIIEFFPEVGTKMERVRKRLDMDPETEALIETIGDKTANALKDRLREYASMDGAALCRKLLPELFGEKP